MRSRIPPWMLTILVALPMSADADFPLDDYMEARGVHDPTWFAEIQDVELRDDHAFTFGVGGMATYDISDPDNPLFLGRFQPSGHPWNRYYRGAVGPDAVYAGGRALTISVIDIADLWNPTLILDYGTTGLSYEGLALEGDLLVAARHGDGLELIDVANPSAPVTLSTLTNLTDAWDLEIRGSLAYVADGSGGLRLVDLTDPYLPFIAATLPTSGSAKDVDVEGGLAVVACGSAGLDIFDVSDPENVQKIGHANSSGLAITVDLDGTLAFVADWDDVEVLDLSVPQSPGFAAWEKTPVRAMGLAARDGRAYVADWNRFRIYDFGPTLTQDVHVSIDELTFTGMVPGVPQDTSFVVFNTGGSNLFVNDVNSFDFHFIIHEPLQFTIPPGGEHEVMLTYTPSDYDNSTFFTVESDDPDEATIDFPVHAGADGGNLDIGEDAPDWTHRDIDNNVFTLSDYLGRVVVMAFFADW